MVFLTSASSLAQIQPRDYAVELTAKTKADPPEITLHWRGDQYARSYKINRKAREGNEWAQVGTAAGHETWFTDRNVTTGVGYEYQVVKEGTLQYTGYGYIYAAIQLPAVEDRGRIILLAESSIAAALQLELNRLEYDLIGDGWRVVRLEAPKEAKVTEVKELIRTTYAEDPANTRALFLFGNIPVPYSGDFTPDEHENHKGAWPADVYYGDIDGVWTDTSVTSVGAEPRWNHNVPGDGKFDQSEPPSKIELQVGRVDLSRMTCFLNKSPSRNEVDLLRGYLEKDHAFRHGRLPTDARGLVFDRIGHSTPEPLATMAWRNFAPFAGSNIEEVGWADYLPAVSSKTYLWTAVVAGGSFSHSDGVGSSDAFALYDVNAVFTMFSGSYYGDWDNESNFLRAALGANGRVLVSVYSAQPQWICHTMALGETIGAAAKITQENDAQGIYIPHNRGAGQVHVALHGDPALRAHPLASPANLRAQALSGSVLLSWEPTAATDFVGYWVYEGSSASGPFQRISASPVQSTTFMVEGGDLKKHYMVKTVGVTTSPSGTYWNTSQGTFFPDPMASTAQKVPAAPRNLVVMEVRPDAISLRWLSSSSDHTGFEVERLDPGANGFVKIASLTRDKLDYRDTALPAPGIYGYRVRAINAAGGSDYSNPVFPSTQVATAEFIGLDRKTQGSWLGRYGTAGYIIPEIAEKLPLNFSHSVSNVFIETPGFQNDDPRALQIPDSTNRSANYWLHMHPMAFHLNFQDDLVHQVAFYTIGFGRGDTVFDLELYDAVTGSLLDRRHMDDNNEGVYVVYNVRRQVILRIIPPGNFIFPEIYGVFIDDPKVFPVQIEPEGGAFVGKTLVSLSTITPQTEIRYTTDGTEPGPASTRYTEPFWLYANAHLRARAFREGYPPSEITESLFQNTVENRFGLIGWDESQRGNWIGKYGADGFWVAAGGKQLPAYAEVNIKPETPWLWSDNAQEERAPFRDKGTQQRVGAAWYGDEELVLDLGIFDTKRRAVALYFLDWDRRGRTQEVEIVDASGVVRDNYRIENFANGKYLVLGVKGYVKVRIKRVQGSNAILNGIFFDAAPIEVNVGSPVPLSDPRVANGLMTFTVTGIEDQRFCLDRSHNLSDWSCFSTNVILAPRFEMQIPVSPEESVRFLRGHIVP